VGEQGQWVIDTWVMGWRDMGRGGWSGLATKGNFLR
jgi:hypothetical protein